MILLYSNLTTLQKEGVGALADKKKIIWWAVLGVLLIVAVGRLLLPGRTGLTVEQASNSREIIVYVTGAVQTAGLLRLPLDTRLDDALQAAGLLPEADFEVLNPAQRLKDGQKIIVPYKPQTLQAETGLLVPAADPAGSPAGSVGFSAQPASPKIQASSRININTASVEELQKIKGVGPALAQYIVTYRQEQGLFLSPEDIQKVSGIGPKTYEKMADQITVGP